MVEGLGLMVLGAWEASPFAGTCSVLALYFQHRNLNPNPTFRQALIASL